MDNAQIKSKLKEWEEGPLKEELERFGERKEAFTTMTGRPVKRLYTPLDLEEVGFDYLKDVGFPGQYPYTRGTRPNMHRSVLPSMSVISGFGGGEEASHRFKRLLEQGAQGLVIELDLPTQMGLDSDNPLAAGEVGRNGVAIDSLADLEEALDVPLEKVKYLYLVVSSNAAILVAMLVALCEKRGISFKDTIVTVKNSPLGEYISYGNFVLQPRDALRLSVDTIEYCAENQPNWIPWTLVAGEIRSFNVTPAEQFGIALSMGLSYLDEAQKRGIDIGRLTSRMEIMASVTPDFFEGVAGIRALRKVWARLISERYGVKDPHSLTPRFYLAGMAGLPCFAQPLNNITRYAIGTLAVALANGDNWTVPAYDEAHALPTEESTRVSTSIMHIVTEESGVMSTIDPLAGSYYVEYLTKKNEEDILKIIKEVDEMGGALKAIETGYYVTKLADASYRWQRDVEQGKKILIGVNKLVVEEERQIEIFHLDPELEKKQIEKVQRIRKERDNAKVDQALRNLKEAAKGEDNLLPYLVETVKTYATLGEICGALVEVFGPYKDIVPKL